MFKTKTSLVLIALLAANISFQFHTSFSRKAQLDRGVSVANLK